MICTYHGHVFQHALIISRIYELEPKCFFVEFSQFVIIFALYYYNSAADCLLGFQYILHGQQEEFLPGNQLVGTIVEVLAHLTDEIYGCTKLVFSLKACDLLAEGFAGDAVEV